MNKITLHGRLVRDPEMKAGGSGVEYCRFTVAVDRRPVKDKPKESDFFDCTAFGATGAAISKYIAKGRDILIEGRMESSKSEKDGVRRTYWGVVVETFEFCGGRNDAPAPAPAVDAGSGMEVAGNEELPF